MSAATRKQGVWQRVFKSSKAPPRITGQDLIECVRRMDAAERQEVADMLLPGALTWNRSDLPADVSALELNQRFFAGGPAH
jgi:hypothetical protein